MKANVWITELSVNGELQETGTLTPEQIKEVVEMINNFSIENEKE